MYPFASEWHMPISSFEPYCAEVRRLADVYKDKIKIVLGFEADYLPGFSVPRFDVYKNSIRNLSSAQFTLYTTATVILKRTILRKMF